MAGSESQTSGSRRHEERLAVPAVIYARLLARYGRQESAQIVAGLDMRRAFGNVASPLRR